MIFSKDWFIIIIYSLVLSLNISFFLFLYFPAFDVGDMLQTRLTV